MSYYNYCERAMNTDDFADAMDAAYERYVATWDEESPLLNYDAWYRSPLSYNAEVDFFTDYAGAR